MVSVMRRVAAISAGPRSASPRGRRARSFWGFFGFSAMGGVGTSAGATRQPGLLLLPLPLLRGRVGVGATRAPLLVAFPTPTLPRKREREQCARLDLRRRGFALGLHFRGIVGHQLLADL